MEAPGAALAHAGIGFQLSTPACTFEWNASIVAWDAITEAAACTGIGQLRAVHCLMLQPVRPEMQPDYAVDVTCSLTRAGVACFDVRPGCTHLQQVTLAAVPPAIVAALPLRH